MKFVEAVQTLCEENPGYIPLPSQPEQEKNSPSSAAENNRRVFAYLLKRGVDRKVIEACVRAGILYESADYHTLFSSAGMKPALPGMPSCAAPTHGRTLQGRGAGQR